MFGQPWKAVISVLGACVWALMAACPGTAQRPTPQSQTEQPKAPNPAARKCLDDGYELEPVRAADGLPIDHQCVDKASGKRCEVWDYFRGDCRLREAPRR